MRDAGAMSGSQVETPDTQVQDRTTAALHGIMEQGKQRPDRPFPSEVFLIHLTQAAWWKFVRNATTRPPC